MSELSSIVLATLSAEIQSAMDLAVRQAFQAGFELGQAEANETLAKMAVPVRQLSQLLGEADNPIKSAEPIESSVEQDSADDQGASDVTEAELRTYEYGKIGKTVKEVMRSAPRQGLLIADIVSRSFHDHQVEIGSVSAREALKRLKKGGDVICRDRRRWVATEKLRGAKVTNENEALNGNSVSAPSRGEGIRPSPHGQQALGLTG